MPKQKSNFAAMSLGALMEMGAKIQHAISEKVSEERDYLEHRLAALGSFLTGGTGAGKATKKRTNGRATGRKHPLEGRKAPIKFRGPNGETWSGRGLAPRWLAALEAVRLQRL